MSGEVLGSIFNQNGYSTARMRAVWSDENRLKTVCQVETAVAYAMAKNKKIPLSAYEEIKERVIPQNYDMTKLRLAAARAGHFLAGFVSYSQQLFHDGSGQYLHYGAASEDVEDTCYVLQLKQADKIIMDQLVKFGSVLYELTDNYQKTISVAIAHRTYSSPSTLGFKLGIILNELDYLMRRLDSLSDFTFAGSLTGVDGLSTMIGDGYDQVETDFCDELDLQVPEMYWHTQRERFTEYCHVLTMIAQMIGKLGKNLLTMSQTQVGEFQENYAPGRQGSTVIPTVREPYMCEAIVNLSTIIRNEMPLLYDTMQVSGEKDTAVWRDIYVALPEMTMYLSGQLNYATTILKTGKFNTKRMAENFILGDGTMYSGALMMALAKKGLGRQDAHELLVRLRVKADSENQLLKDLFYSDKTIAKYLNRQELDQIMSPEAGVPHAVEKTQKILKLYRQRHPLMKEGVMNHGTSS
ncbi:lyase family protein [Lentilactobacillus raoultii]|uniref:Lyase family protein n=1 Tax=Lentilactobacillus raoultii TaxID=1987503 RepID=A0ABW3PPA5_9LACO|nr:lyase family protein [Lentilactobacillus raoultii]